MSMDLVEFLVERLDEDEAVARMAYDGVPWDVSLDQNGDAWVTQAGEDHQSWRIAMTQESPAGHIARHDPARVLAEVTAKRAILTELASGEEYDVSCGEGHWGNFARIREALAQPYADHPDFNRAWLSPPR